MCWHYCNQSTSIYKKKDIMLNRCPIIKSESWDTGRFPPLSDTSLRSREGLGQLPKASTALLPIFQSTVKTGHHCDCVGDSVTFSNCFCCVETVDSVRSSSAILCLVLWRRWLSSSASPGEISRQTEAGTHTHTQILTHWARTETHTAFQKHLNCSNAK